MAKRVLVYGVGVIGSVYALRLSKAGIAVSVVARGERLSSIRSSGLVIRHALLGDEERADVEIFETAPEAGDFDLVLVALRSGQVESALNALAEARVGGPVAVIGNNLGDLRGQAAIVGAERFLPGFGMIGGYRDGGSIVYLDSRSARKRALKNLGKTTLGTIDERAGPALGAACGLLASAGLPVAVNPDIAAWRPRRDIGAGGDTRRDCQEGRPSPTLLGSALALFRPRTRRSAHPRRLEKRQAAAIVAVRASDQGPCPPSAGRAARYQPAEYRHGGTQSTGSNSQYSPESPGILD